MKLLEELRQGTLFAKTTITITVTSFLFITFTLGLLAYFIIMPTAERSAKSLTTNLFMAADMWYQSADEDRHVVLQFLKSRYQIGIAQNKQQLANPADNTPFFI